MSVLDSKNCKFCPFSRYIVNSTKNAALVIFGGKKEDTKILMGKGFRLDDIKRENFIDIYLELQNRKGHWFIFATTRAGKTRLAELIIEQDIVKIGANVVIFDPKIDDGLLNRTYQAAVRANRIEDFMLCSTIHPEYSVKINPLSHYYTPGELINNVVAAVPAKDEFFYNTAYETVSIIVYVRLYMRKITKDSTSINLKEIFKYSSYNGLKSLEESLKRVRSEDEDKQQYLIMIEKILESERDYFSRVTATLRTTLSQMIIGDVGKVIGNVSTNRFLERLENDEGVILYVQTPSMVDKKTSDTLAKTILSMIQCASGRRYIEQRPFKKPLCVHIDEASNALYIGSEFLFNKSGGSNVMITASTQSVPDLEVALGQDRARMIINNTNYKTWLRIVDANDAKAAASYSGTIKKYETMISTNSITARETEDAAIDYKELLNFQPREFYHTGLEGDFRGKTAPVGDTEIKIIFPSNKSFNKETVYE